MSYYTNVRESKGFAIDLARAVMFNVIIIIIIFVVVVVVYFTAVYALIYNVEKIWKRKRLLRAFAYVYIHTHVHTSYGILDASVRRRSTFIARHIKFGEKFFLFGNVSCAYISTKSSLTRFLSRLCGSSEVGYADRLFPCRVVHYKTHLDSVQRTQR